MFKTRPASGVMGHLGHDDGLSVESQSAWTDCVMLRGSPPLPLEARDLEGSLDKNRKWLNVVLTSILLIRN